MFTFRTAKQAPSLPRAPTRRNRQKRLNVIPNQWRLAVGAQKTDDYVFSKLIVLVIPTACVIVPATILSLSININLFVRITTRSGQLWLVYDTHPSPSAPPKQTPAPSTVLAGRRRLIHRNIMPNGLVSRSARRKNPDD